MITVNGTGNRLIYFFDDNGEIKTLCAVPVWGRPWPRSEEVVGGGRGLLPAEDCFVKSELTVLKCIKNVLCH